MAPDMRMSCMNSSPSRSLSLCVRVFITGGRNVGVEHASQMTYEDIKVSWLLLNQTRGSSRSERSAQTGSGSPDSPQASTSQHLAPREPLNGDASRARPWPVQLMQSR